VNSRQRKRIAAKESERPKTENKSERRKTEVEGQKPKTGA